MPRESGKEGSVMTKKSIRTEAKRRMAIGRALIASAEFRFGIAKEITREQFDAQVAEGNRQILDALDLSESTYASNWQELAAVVGLA